MSDFVVTPDEMPEWLTADFLREQLSIAEKCSLQSVEFACAKGENFASKIYRVVIALGDESTKSLIVKSRPLGGGFSEEFTKKFNVFPKEIEMYEKIDRIEEMFRLCGANVVFAPKCLSVSSTPTDILIIEDLNEKGFKMASKSEGLRKAHMEIVLTRLAQFHAASAVNVENNGALDEKYSRGIYNVDMKEIFEQNFETFFGFVLDECLSTWPGLDSVILDKMRAWRSDVLNELIRTMTPKQGQFSCLNHGDAWLPNILFHYDSECGVLDDCQFIDFQQSVFTSPAVDLLSLIFTSADTETKLQNFELYVRFYHEQLVDALKLLKYSKSIPTLKELHSDLFDRGFLGVWHSFCMLPVVLVENVKESSSDNLLGENEEGLNYKRKLYNNDRYREHMTVLLTYFNNRGLLDAC